MLTLAAAEFYLIAAMDFNIRWTAVDRNKVDLNIDSCGFQLLNEISLVLKSYLFFRLSFYLPCISFNFIHAL